MSGAEGQEALPHVPSELALVNADSDEAGGESALKLDLHVNLFCETSAGATWQVNWAEEQMSKVGLKQVAQSFTMAPLALAVGKAVGLMKLTVGKVAGSMKEKAIFSFTVYSGEEPHKKF